jgi:uncharacterized protein
VAPAVVCDTNVLLSGYGWGGKPGRCIQMARVGRVASITCAETLTEFEARLITKATLPAPVAAALVSIFRPFSQLVTVPHTLHGVAADPDDDIIIEAPWSEGPRTS